MSFKLTLDFATDEDRNSFIGWFLDGGGEYQFNDTREMHDEPRLDQSGPGGGDWEWGEDGAPGKQKAENYTIELRPYPDDDAEDGGK